MPLEHLKIRPDFLAARDRAWDEIATERRRVIDRADPWPVWATSAYRYESAFRPVLRESFGNFFAERRRLKGQVYAMDVMGAATFARPSYVDYEPEKRVDGEAGMTLVDFRSKAEKQADRARKRQVFAGDALGIMPWLKAQEFIDQNDTSEFPGFDLITCHPVGGWNILRESKYSTNPHHDFFEWVMIQRMFRLLSPHGGTLYAKMATDGNYTQWIDKLKEVEGLEVEGKKNVIRIVKESSKNIFLPKITGVKRPVFGKDTF